MLQLWQTRAAIFISRPVSSQRHMSEPQEHAAAIPSGKSKSIFGGDSPLLVHKRSERMDTDKDITKSRRGFASMDPEKQRAIARRGGESVPNEKRSFSQNPELAAQAGRKGGRSVAPAKRSFSQNHSLASEAGRKGGHAAHGGVTRKPTIKARDEI
jgi:general stress protein YciG